MKWFMVNYGIDTGVRKIADSILVLTAKAGNAEWFAEDITINLSNSVVIAPIVVDFSYDVSSVIEYTLNSGTTWSAFNNGLAIDGGQSLFIRVTDGDQVNFRATIGGNINRVVVSVP